MTGGRKTKTVSFSNKGQVVIRSLRGKYKDLPLLKTLKEVKREEKAK